MNSDSGKFVKHQILEPSYDASIPGKTSIAFLLPGLRRGGSELVTIRLAAILAERGYRVAVVSLLKYKLEIKPPFPDQIEYVFLDCSHVSTSVLLLRAFIRAWKPDVVVGSQPHVNMAAILVKFLMRKSFKLVVAEHAPILVQASIISNWRYRILPLLIPLLYPRADAIVAVSRGIDDEMRKMVPSAKKICLIYNPVVHSEMRRGIASNLSPGYPDGFARPIILAVGRMAPEKDFSTLLKAFAILRKQSDASLVILGEGPMRAVLAEQALELGIAKDLFMPGFIENPLPFMNDADVLVLSSQFEGFGNVLIEAMACGTQVVSTDAPTGPREILGDGRWGRLVSVGDAPGLAKAIWESIHSPIDPNTLRERAATFNVESSVMGYQSLFTTLLSTHGRKPVPDPAHMAVQSRMPPKDARAGVPCDIDKELVAQGRHPDGRPLKIVIYLNDMSGGGAERMRLILIGVLQKAGVEVELLLHSSEGELARKIPAGVPVAIMGTSRVLMDLIPIARHLRRSRPDIFLSSLNHNNVVAAISGLLAGRSVPIIITQHNALSQEAKHDTHWKYRIMPLAYRLVAPFLDAIVAVSDGVADDMAKISGIKRERITRIYNPVVDGGLVARSNEPVAHPWFDEKDIPIFVTAGRMVVQKDHANLLRAFAIYRRKNMGRLMLLGNGPLLDHCRSLATDLGIAEDVAFVGFQENPLPYYRYAKAFVLSSLYEGFGNVLVEAMACGVPVISTDCPHGPSEILDGGRFGRLVPVSDPAALAAAMDPNLREHFPETVLLARAAEFTAERSSLQYLDLFQTVLASRASKAS